MKIILSGGGTLGPVVPLLAIAEQYKVQHPEAQFVWVGTKNGPERSLVMDHRIPFYALGAGKWRRYFSLLNFLDIFTIIFAFFQSLVFILREKPDLLISGGGFVSVPLHWAGFFLGVPSWVHQQDVRIGLANRLMFPIAKKITTALHNTVTALPAKKTEWIGNPVRDLSVADLAVSRQKFKIPAAVPVIFALGGGTGSASINKLVLEMLTHIPAEWHVIHLTGKERPRELSEQATEVFPNYHVYPFLTEEMKDAYAVADVVIARAGFSTLTELAALGKASIIFPIFDTHQEENAREFAKQGGIIMLEKGQDTGVILSQVVRDLIDTPQKKQALGETFHRLMPRATSEKITLVIDELVT